MAAKHALRLELIKEVTEAAYVVISTPMWNWSAPSVVKAWIDQIVMPGVLDPYTQKNLKGKVTVLISSGGSYLPESHGGHGADRDFESKYLGMVPQLLGSEDVVVIRTEFSLAGVMPGMDELIPKKEESFAKASADAIARAQAL